MQGFAFAGIHAGIKKTGSKIWGSFYVMRLRLQPLFSQKTR